MAIGDIENASRRCEGAFGFVGVDDHYFLSAIVPPATPLEVQLQPDCRSRVGAEPRAAVHLVERPLAFGAAERGLLLRPERPRRSRRASSRIWCARSTSACSTFWSCRCCARSSGSTATSATTAGRSSCSRSSSTWSMFPLKHKSIVSMRKMQELQPRDEGDPGSLREAEDDRPRRARR